jgi:hypothetical protein
MLNLHKIEDVLKQIHTYTNKNIFLELIGGESTLHPDLISFCKRIIDKQYIDTIYIYSNFSASINIYLELI